MRGASGTEAIELVVQCNPADLLQLFAAWVAFSYPLRVESE